MKNIQDFADVKPSVLVLEDDVNYSKYVNIVLRKNYNVFNEKTVQEGLNLMSNQDIHCVLLDISLGGEDGLDFAREIRKKSEFTNLPVYALTGWGKKEDIQNSLDAGCDKHLTKPILAPELLKYVDTAVEKYLELIQQV